MRETSLLSGPLVLNMCIPCMAQPEVGTLQGSVVDSEGRPLAEVLVVVTSPVLDSPRRTLSDASGLFRFHALESGRYDIVLTHQAQTLRHDEVEVKWGATTTLPRSCFSAVQGRGSDIVEQDERGGGFVNPDGHPGTIGISPKLGDFTTLNEKIEGSGPSRDLDVTNRAWNTGLSLIIPADSRTTVIADVEYISQTSGLPGIGVEPRARFWLGTPRK